MKNKYNQIFKNIFMKKIRAQEQKFRKCKCGCSFPRLMKRRIEDGSSFGTQYIPGKDAPQDAVYVICPECGCRTEENSKEKAILDWNNSVTRPSIHITNIKLFNILRQNFEECWYGNHDIEVSKEKLCSVICEFLKLLNKYPSFWVETKYYNVITRRQVTCGKAALEYAEKGEFDHALHEFMDCIDNYGEIYNSERAITPNEYMLYLGVASVFQLLLKKEEIDTKSEESEKETS